MCKKGGKYFKGKWFESIIMLKFSVFEKKEMWWVMKTGYFTAMGNTKECGKWYEPPLTVPKASLHLIRYYCMYSGIRWHSSFMSVFQRSKQFIWANAAFNNTNWGYHSKKSMCLELVHRKGVIFHQGNERLHISFML